MLQPWSPYGKFYVAGNEISGYPAISNDNWSGGVQADHPDSAKADVAFQAVPITQHTARKAFDLVLAHAGASHKRDIVDSRIAQEVRNGVSVSGKANNGIIDSPNDVGGWPELKSLTAPLDSDKDGMPDEWENKKKLNPNDPSDAGNAGSANSFYTNIEDYLNSLTTSR